MLRQHNRTTTVRRGWSATPLRAVATGAAVLVAVAACGSAPSKSAGATASTKPLVVGISLPLTGDFSQPGGEARKGYEIWRDQVNAAGGLLGRQVQLKVTDDASNQDTVVTDYTKLITQDKVDLLLGTFSTLLNFPASAVAEKNRMLYVEPAGGAPKMFTRGYTHLFFAQQATASHQPDVFVEYLKSLPEAQRPKTAAYPTQDDPFTTPVITSMQKQLEALGVKTVYTTTYPADATNLQTIASAIAAKKPDLIAQGAVFEDGVGLVRSLQQLKYSPKFLFQTSAPTNAGQYSSGIGVKNTEGASTPSAGTRRRRRRATRRSSPSTPSATTVRSRPRTPPTPTPQRRCSRQQPRASASWTRTPWRLAAREQGGHDPRSARLGPDGCADVAVPARPVAERRGGDRRTEGGRHGRQAVAKTPWQ